MNGQKSKKSWTGRQRALLGCFLGAADTPFDDHQLLALSYADDGSGIVTLTVWDNRQGPKPRDLTIDFTRSDGLSVQNDFSGADIRGIFLENYSLRQPPDSLHFPYPRV